MLALDLGTNTGWAIGQDGKLLECGTWKLATAKEIALAGKNRMSRRLDLRIPRLWQYLLNEHALAPIDWVVFEDVEFLSTRLAAHLWASFRTAVWIFASASRVQIECLGVQKLKQFATGHGGATKEMMVAALVRQHPEDFRVDSAGNVHYFAHGKDDFVDDNCADAVHLLKWSMKTLKHA